MVMVSESQYNESVHSLAARPYTQLTGWIAVRSAFPNFLLGSPSMNISWYTSIMIIHRLARDCWRIT